MVDREPASVTVGRAKQRVDRPKRGPSMEGDGVVVRGLRARCVVGAMAGDVLRAEEVMVIAVKPLAAIAPGATSIELRSVRIVGSSAGIAVLATDIAVVRATAGTSFVGAELAISGDLELRSTLTADPTTAIVIGSNAVRSQRAAPIGGRASITALTGNDRLPLRM